MLHAKDVKNAIVFVKDGMNFTLSHVQFADDGLVKIAQCNLPDLSFVGAWDCDE